MKNFLHRTWHWVRWPLGVVVLLYVGLVAYRVPAMFEKDKTDAAVAKIHAQKITLADVLGTALPSPPNEQENNSTVAGIDKNNNGIRDDVELAIFAKYPDGVYPVRSVVSNGARIRAAELQYAMTEQMFLTDVFNTETWKAVAEEDSRASACIGLASGDDFNLYRTRSKEVEALVFNSKIRKDAETTADKFTTSYGLPNTDLCNVDLNKLPD